MLFEKLGVMCEVVRGSSPRPKGDPKYYGGSIPRLMVSDLSRDGRWVTPKTDYLTPEGAKLSRTIKAGTVVMVVSGDVGVTARLKIDACIHDGFVAFKNLNKLIDSDFLEYYLQNIKWTHAKRKVGAIFQNLTTKQIKEIKIPVPSLSTQKRIVSILERAEKLKEKRKQANELITKLPQSIFLEMFGDPIKNAKDFDESTLHELSKLITDGTHNTPQLTDSGIPLLDSTNIDDFYIDESSPKKFISTETDAELLKRCKPLEEDILISSRGTIGKIAIVKKGQNFNIMGNIILLRPDKKQVTPIYLSRLLMHRVKILENTSHGSSQKGLYLNQIRRLRVPVPPINLQTKFSSKIEQYEKLKARLVTSELEITKLFDSLMQKAFNGELVS